MSEDPVLTLSRRRALQAAGAGALGSGVWAAALDAAVAAPVKGGSGTIMDVEHVVILMQENRSFDHYFGTMRGVRGFSDPRVIDLPGGDPVWRQPTKKGGAVGPFRLNARKTSAETIQSLDHSWKRSHDLWKRYDAWAKVKTPMTMGYFEREDIPFYYALADAFTVCDAYHCSLFGPTNPNRMYLFSGTSGLAVGEDGPLAVQNSIIEVNETADPKNDHPKYDGFKWKTYAERLEAAGVSWKLYQEYDNYGDNGLAYFDAFRGIGPNSPLYQKGRAWAAGSTPENAKTSRGEHLVAAFQADVEARTLPAVSWIVAPYIACEHPKATPAYGQDLTARLIAALAAHPEVFARTAFILTYDENDGFFDHAPPPLPAIDAGMGKSTVSTVGEVYKGVPVGLGPRVPTIVVSPWTRGGWVNSQVFDHTSIIRFLERRFGVQEPNITPWRRAVCGDLTSAFDFTAAAAPPGLPKTGVLVRKADLAAALPRPVVAGDKALPRQEAGRRPARALPYDLHVTGRAAADGFHLVLANAGSAGAAFNVYAADTEAGPWFYTLGAGDKLADVLALPGPAYDVRVFGPNGYLRRYKGEGTSTLAAQLVYDPARRAAVVTLRNLGDAPCRVTVKSAYGGKRDHTLVARASTADPWPLKPSDEWYDLTLTTNADPAYLHRFAGHFETGRPSVSDPALSPHHGLFGL